MKKILHTIFRFMLIIFLFIQKEICFSQAIDDYRSAVSGTWSTRANWQRWDGSAWLTPTAGQGAPDGSEGVVTVLSPHVMTISGAVSIDQVTINSGGTVQTSGSIVLTIANGVGIDLQIDGTFIDGSSSSVAFSGTPTGAKWAFGATGTLIKISGSCSNCWQTDYNGGASAMPSTANWILRKTGTSNPPISTIGAYYPNLTIENNYTSAWTTATTSTFTGASGFPTIKGNFDIGGTGTNTVDFLNDNTNATAALVQGNMTVRTGNTLRNYGTGFELQGNVTVDGTLQYDASDARRLIFSEGNAQSFSGTGTVNIYAMTMSKSGNSLTLNRAITVDNVLTLTTGLINTTATNLLSINVSGSVTATNNSSFVNGPVRYVGTSAFTFPVGKGSDYQPLGYGASGGGGIFWTETCNGANGAWTQTNTGANSASANIWYISCEEDGLLAGQCGSACAVGNSIHLSSTTLGDIGAAYDAGQTTNKRAESPTINCTGRAGITLAFTYIEFGEGATDDATLWYYDGAAWALLSNPAKAPCCGGACDGQVQGQWTAYSIALPASADNNANVKIGFNWTNNASGGTDPSFAVDNITLSAPATVDFTCEYFLANPQTTFNNVLISSLDHISAIEYWILTRNAGSASKTVTPSWDANSGGVTLLPDLRVARWDGATWQNEGNTATTGNLSAGTVSSGTVSSFSPFTLASVSSQNPLPVELLVFEAEYNGQSVDIKWITASEKNSDYFAVQRSADGKIFHGIARVKAAGNSSTVLNYSSEDKETLPGISYYRLRETDFDGAYSYSNVVAVNIKEDASLLKIISIVNGSDDNLTAWIQSDGNSFIKLEIIDDAGKLIRSFHFQSANGITQIPLGTHSFAKGIYFLKANDGKNVRIEKIGL